MKTKIILYGGILLFLAGISSLTYCTSKGCTDPDACNYDYEADKDDGTCNYGCYGIGGGAGGTGGGNSSGQVSFYTTSDQNCGYITVNIAGYSS